MYRRTPKTAEKANFMILNDTMNMEHSAHEPI